MPAYNDLQCDWGITLFGEFLYWYGRETNLPYIEKLENIQRRPGDPNNRKLVPNSLEYVGTKWDPGYRAGIGFNICDGWDLTAYWTSFENKKKSSVSVPPFDSDDTDDLAIGQKILYEIWLDLGTESSMNRASALWKFCFTSIDGEIGRRYWLSKYFNLRPFGGIRAIWTDTDFTAKSFRDDRDGEPLKDTSLTKKFSNTFQGVGVVGSMQPAWYFSRCFGIYGGADIALLWGKHKMQLKGIILDVDDMGDPDDDFTFKTNTDYFGLQAILDIEFGLRFDATWCCNRYRTNIDIGWEHQILFDHNQHFMHNFEANAIVETHHDVGFGGLVARLRFDF